MLSTHSIIAWISIKKVKTQINYIILNLSENSACHAPVYGDTMHADCVYSAARDPSMGEKRRLHETAWKEEDLLMR